MHQAKWQVNESGQYAISGVLDRDSVPALWSELKQMQMKQHDAEVSLQQLNRIDSAGMVMLIHLIEHAKKQNCHIMLSFVPKQLRTLFQLSNVEQHLDGHLKI
ncbi:putative anti-sigma B factor antagonist [Vibrio sinaloensis DSM 21326]|uniref:Putative anti-sigma B factor antagonist n=1 Tax=Vibrio sinaloensis DSM 21326 TaxID=945550 RepID=E8M9P8_PHOS4|nr:lipid asymmetry maintenance protein MlaB [Vibrio sinaloensis]EGA69277.1 putative anti-sigma B factor antagonist [Vibrio sinaloensis DSM 21326]